MGPLESQIRLRELRRQQDPLATVKQAAKLLDRVPAAAKRAAAARGETHYVFWRNGKATLGCRRGGARGVGAGKRASTGVQRRSRPSWEARLAVAKAKAAAKNRVCMCRGCIAARKVATAALAYKGTGA